MADEISQGADLRTQGVVLSDVPHIRRSVMRALRRKKIPLFDSRDPTEIRSAEWIKWAWNRLFSRLHDQQWELRALGDEAQRLLRSDLGQEEADHMESVLEILDETMER